MMLFIGLFFFLISFLLFMFSLFEERDTNTESLDEQDKSDNIVIIFLVFSAILGFVAAACIMSANDSYYSVTTDTIVYVHNPVYKYLAYLPIGFAIVQIILIARKVFDVLQGNE